jgi:hypothetical protein
MVRERGVAFAAPFFINIKRMNYANHLEPIVEQALKDAGVKYNREGKSNRLDFYLPEFDVYVEVKEYYTPRSDKQLADHENVILLQGKKSVEAFCKMLSVAITI